MALYKTGINPSQMAQSAMNAATQAAASQTKQTTTKVKTEGNVWDDIYKGAAAIAAVGRGVNSLVDAAGSAWDMYDQYKLRSAYDDVSKAFGQGGFESIQNNPDMQDYWHAQAVGQFVKDRAGTEKGRLEMLKSMDAAADKQYQDWRVQAMTVNKAFQAGDMQQFMPLMEQLAATSPLPYRLEGTQDGKFRVLFRSDQHQGWTATGQLITPQEAMAEVNKVLQGEQSVLRGLDGKLHPVNPGFNAAAARYYWGTVMGNAENRLDPKKQIPLYDSGGNVVGLGVIQNPVDDYGAQPRLLVFDRRGRQVGVYDGMEGVLQAGMSPYRPAKQKGSGEEKNTEKKFNKLVDQHMARAGFLKDEKQGWWYNIRTDDSGKQVPDYTRPATQDDVNMARDLATGKGLKITVPPIANTGGRQGALDSLGRGKNAAAGQPYQKDNHLGGSDYSAPEVWSGRFAPRGNLSSADNQLGGDGARNAFRRQEEARETDARLNDAMSGYDERNYGSGALSRLGTDNDDAYFSERFKEQRMKEERKRYPMRPISPLFRLGE